MQQCDCGCSITANVIMLFHKLYKYSESIFRSVMSLPCIVGVTMGGEMSMYRVVAECHQKRLNQDSFALLYFVLFPFSGLCFVSVLSVFLICLLSRIFQHVPT